MAYTDSRNAPPEFGSIEEARLTSLRAYVEELRALESTINADFPGDESRKALYKLHSTLEETAAKIVDLETQKIQSKLKASIY
jgi:hypothetical protein